MVEEQALEISVPKGLLRHLRDYFPVCINL